jgi:Tfp pilus assembly protein PilX
VELEDQQQRSERGTTRAGVLLAVVGVVRLMVVLIRIGSVARGFAEQERGATGETETAVAFEEALRAGEARGVNHARFLPRRCLGGCKSRPVLGPGETSNVRESPPRIPA